jgi:hypothetical protein
VERRLDDVFANAHRASGEAARYVDGMEGNRQERRREVQIKTAITDHSRRELEAALSERQQQHVDVMMTFFTAEAEKLPALQRTAYLSCARMSLTEGVAANVQH